MTMLADIERMIDEWQPMPDPFNGATRLILSPALFDALRSYFIPAPGTALDFCLREFEVRAALPPGYGVGYRAWRRGDDPETEFMGEQMVWFCGPKATD